MFKAFFDRRRDWADLEDMLAARSIDADVVAAVLADHLRQGDDRIAKLRAMERDVGRSPPGSRAARAEVPSSS